VPRHSAGGVGMFVRTYVVCTWYVRGTYCSQCACASNGSKELHHFYYIWQWTRIYSTEMALRNDYGFSWIY